MTGYDVRLKVNEYVGVFDNRVYGKVYRTGRWRKFAQIGNAGVALDVAEMLRKLGHKVQIVESSIED
jgi:hypothetical protein